MHWLLSKINSTPFLPAFLSAKRAGNNWKLTAKKRRLSLDYVMVIMNNTRDIKIIPAKKIFNFSRFFLERTKILSISRVFLLKILSIYSNKVIFGLNDAAMNCTTRRPQVIECVIFLQVCTNYNGKNIAKKRLIDRQRES